MNRARVARTDSHGIHARTYAYGLIHVWFVRRHATKNRGTCAALQFGVVFLLSCSVVVVVFIERESGTLLRPHAFMLCYSRTHSVRIQSECSGSDSVYVVLVCGTKMRRVRCRFTDSMRIACTSTDSHFRVNCTALWRAMLPGGEQSARTDMDMKMYDIIFRVHCFVCTH